MMKFKIFFTICALLSLSACSSQKNFFFPVESVTLHEDGSFQINDPANKILILYTPGANDNHKGQICWKNAGTPKIIMALNGRKVNGKEIIVHGYCSNAVGNIRGKIRSKSEARAPDLEKMVRRYQAQGVPPGQIFVAGNSMGGWSAILVAAKKNVEIAGTITFAPANGVFIKGARRPYHAQLIKRQTTDVAGVKRIDALMFLFEGDPYNSPEDLAHMQSIPGVEYVAFKPCGNSRPHKTYKDECFIEANKDRIWNYIQKRVTQAQ